MQTNHSVVWIDHRSAQVIHFDHEKDDVTTVTSKHGKEHLHHKEMTIGDGNCKSHPDYFVDVMSAIGESDEILLVGPADAKTEFRKYAESHRPEVAKRIVKVEPMDRVSSANCSTMHGTFLRCQEHRLAALPRVDSPNAARVSDRNAALTNGIREPHCARRYENNLRGRCRHGHWVAPFR